MLNGPNLDLLGEREAEIYGSTNLKSIEGSLFSWLENNHPEVGLDFLQTNSESVLIDKLNSSHNAYNGLIINPGALAHYSVALRDSLKAFPAPKVEVHISNPIARENFRQTMLTAGAVNAVILGMGAYGYLLALQYLLKTYQH